MLDLQELSPVDEKGSERNVLSSGVRQRTKLKPGVPKSPSNTTLSLVIPQGMYLTFCHVSMILNILTIDYNYNMMYSLFYHTRTAFSCLTVHKIYILIYTGYL